MNKFFLQSPKPKLLWQDHRVVSFKQFQTSLKKFKLFQIQKIIKKIKTSQSTDLESKLQFYKRISPSLLSRLAIYVMDQLKVDMNEVKQHIKKVIPQSVEDTVAVLEEEMKKQDGLLAQFYKQYKAHALYLKAKLFATQTKKRQKKRNKTANKQLMKKQRQENSKSTQKQYNKKQPIQPIKTRYPQKSFSTGKTDQYSKFNKKAQPKEEEKKPDLHPSWQAKIQQNKSVAFMGKKTSLI